VGVAASRLAGRFGLAAADALCAGLLHDLGVALAYQFDSEAYAKIAESAPVDLLAAEALRFGADHAQLGGIALAAWRLPSTIVDGVASHHGDVAGSLTLTHAVIAGEALVQIALPDAGAFGYDPAADPEAVLFELGIAAPEVHELASRVSDDAEQISAMLVAA
ncbi:MAG: putative domain HDIG-containing protein, partial [Actinomycetia bacterium]|nr:putative domain HDIG-containing protein [Actinomycetes bacterium]